MKEEIMEKKDTLKERCITVRLSDETCRRLAARCGECGLTIGELIEYFVCDLVGGERTNGSDERMYANRWFERCGFGMFQDETLLRHLILWGYDPGEYIDILDNIETAKNDKAYLEEHPEEANEEAAYIDEDIADWEEDLSCMREGWEPSTKPDMDEQIKIIKDWIQNTECFMEGSPSVHTVAQGSDLPHIVTSKSARRKSNTLRIQDYIDNNENMKICISAKNSKDDCMSRDIYIGMLADIPEKYRNIEVINSGWLIGAQIHELIILSSDLPKEIRSKPVTRR